MSLVTLTTDYGMKDHYTGALKGQLYSANKDIIIVDINHEVAPFDLISTAFIMKNASSRFPAGTIHIAIINIRDGNSRYLIVKRNENYYLLPDNGLVCMMFPDEDFDVYAFKNLPQEYSYSDLHNALSTMIHAIQNSNLEAVSVPVTSYKVLSLIKPYESNQLLKGAVLYIDCYQNIITNITKDIFVNYVQENKFMIMIRETRITRISKHYSDVPEGEVLAMFNDSGYLEIALNKSTADSLLGLKYGQIILVELLKN